MRALGFEVKKADVLKILKDYDTDGSGKIKFDDFNEVGTLLQYKPHESNRPFDLNIKGLFPPL